MTTHRLAGVIALIGCSGGCATTGGKVSAIVGTVAAAGAAVAVVNTSSCARRDGEPVECFMDAGTVVILGALAGASFLTALIFEVYGGPELAPAPAHGAAHADAPVFRAAASPTVAIAARDPRAEQLTRQAYLAARIGRCYTVGALGVQVQAIDPVYYDRVFAVEPTIAICR